MIAAALGALVAPAPASAAIAGLEFKEAVSTLNKSEGQKTARAVCTGGKRVIGTGFRINGAPADVLLSALVPSDTAVEARASEDVDGTAANWTVTAIAVCANPLSGLEVVHQTLPSNVTGLQRRIETPCPGTKLLIGLGTEVSAGAEGHIALNQLIESRGLSAGDGSNIDNFTGPWTLTSYAICANLSFANESINARPGLNDSSSPKSAAAPCTVGIGMSAGWSLSAFGGSLVNSAVPSQTNSTVTGSEDDDGFDQGWSIGAQIICLVL